MASSLQAGTVCATPQIIAMQITSIILIMWWFHWCHHHNYPCHWCLGDNNSIIAFPLHYECSCITQPCTAVVSFQLIWLGFSACFDQIRKIILYPSHYKEPSHGEGHKDYIIYSCIALRDNSCIYDGCTELQPRHWWLENIYVIDT